MDRWYVAETHDGMGRTADRNLKRQKFDAWLPEIKELRGGAPTPVQLFPGYVFIRLDLEDDTVRWQAINSTRGVIKLLPHVCLEPLPIRDKVDPVTGERRQFVEEFKALIDGGELDEKPIEKVIRLFVRDETVAVAAGPLAGRLGRVLRYKKGCAILLMDLLGGKIEVEVPTHQVSSTADREAAGPGNESSSDGARGGNFARNDYQARARSTRIEREDGWLHPFQAAV